jgi:hypothetical protein
MKELKMEEKEIPRAPKRKAEAVPAGAMYEDCQIKVVHVSDCEHP